MTTVASFVVVVVVVVVIVVSFLANAMGLALLSVFSCRLLNQTSFLFLTCTRDRNPSLS